MTSHFITVVISIDENIYLLENGFQLDQIDQQQNHYDGWMQHCHKGIYDPENYSMGAQSFVPTLNKLTRVSLWLSRGPNQDIYPGGNILVAIREELDGSDIYEASIWSKDIIETPGDWYDFNFSDCELTPGEIYYIVLYINDMNVDVWWKGGGGINNERYPQGFGFFNSSWFHQWRKMDQIYPWPEYYDFCFITYGYSDLDIIIKDINGGFGVSVNVKNVDSEAFTDLNWSIDVEASIGLILSGSHTENVIDELAVDESETIESNGLRGIGFITITVQAADAEKQATAFLLGPLVLRVNEV
jgi:hypothetical protein